MSVGVEGAIGMRRVCAVFVLGLLGAWVAPQLASASGGGGCGRPVTDARGTSVSIRSFCFTPTVIRIRPGQSVTWTNRDGFPHTVIGANAVWGSFASLGHREQVTYRFPRPGVYSYVCTFHPGMVGTVVVGPGNGAGAAATTTLKTGPILVLPSVKLPSVAPAVSAPHVARVVEPADGFRGTVLVVALLAMLSGAVAVVAVRRRRATT